MLKQCSLTRGLLLYSFIYSQFTYMIFIYLQSFSLYNTAQDHITTTGAKKTPGTNVIREWMSLNRKLVLVAQMKIQLIFSVLINLCWEFWKNFTLHLCANINVTSHRFEWKILSLVTWRFNKLFGLSTNGLKEYNNRGFKMSPPFLSICEFKLSTSN